MNMPCAHSGLVIFIVVVGVKRGGAKLCLRMANRRAVPENTARYSYDVFMM